MSASDNMFILAYRKMNASMEGSVNVFTNDSTNPDMIFNVQCVLNIPFNKEIIFFSITNGIFAAEAAIQNSNFQYFSPFIANKMHLRRHGNHIS